MTRKFITLLGLLSLFFGVSAQNWKPIKENEKYHYKGSSTDFGWISYTAFADSNYVSNSDTTWVLNKIYKAGDMGNIISAISPFYDEVTRKSTGEYVFSQTNNSAKFILKTGAALGDTWLYDAANNVIASIITINEDSILGGVVDSVKTIQLSNNTFYKISKNHGIIQLPDVGNIYSPTQGVNNIFYLVGLEEDGVGAQIPHAFEIFDFEIGDVFQYYVFQYGGDSYNGFSKEGYEKHTVLSKSLQGDSVRYEMQVGINFSKTQKVNAILTSYNETDTYTTFETYYLGTDNSLVNSYPLQMTNETSSVSGNPIICGAIRKDSMNLRTKENIVFYPDMLSRIYTEGLGSTRSYLHYSMGTSGYHNEQYLKAYHKVGKDVVGDLLPDSYFEGTKDWSPLPKDGEHYHYQFVSNDGSKSNRIYTAWVESASLNASNEKVAILPSIYEYYNPMTPITAPNCLGNEVIKSGMYYIFKEKGVFKFRLQPNASIGTQWFFDESGSITAKTIAYQYLPIAKNRETQQAEMDSVQIVYLGGSDTLKLSKHYGIVDFPDYLNHNGHHILYGIEEQPIGRKMPVFEDFSLEIGDLLEYKEDYNNSFQGGVGSQKHTIFQGQVVDIQDYHYIMRGRRLVTSEDFAFSHSEGESTVFESDAIDTITFAPSDFEIVKDFPGHLYLSAHEDFDGTIVKTYKDPGNTSREAQEGLGVIYDSFTASLVSGGEESSKTLVAYRKTNGRHGGTFSGDEVFNKKNIELVFNMYPNPAKEELRILNYSLRDGGFHILLYDGTGRLIRSKYVPFGQEDVLDLTHVPRGLYFVSILSGEIVSTKILMKE